MASGRAAFGLPATQVKFLRIRGGLMVFRFAVIAGVLVLLTASGVIHP